VGPDDGGVQHHPFEIGLSRHGLEDLVQHAHLDPAIVAFLGPLERPKALRQIPPPTTRARHPQQRIYEQATVAARTPFTLPATRHERLDPLPLIVPQNLTFQDSLQKAALNQHFRFMGILNRP
jgi:hypothetical protein